MDFEFLPPPLDLVPWIVGFAQRRDTRPLGSALELPLPYPLLQFLSSARYEVGSATGGMSEYAPSAGIWGPTTTPVRARHEGALHAFVVILTYTGLHRMTGFMPALLVNRRIPMSALDSPADRLETGLRSLPAFSDKVDLTLAWFRSLPPATNRRDCAHLGIVDTAISAKTSMPVSRLAERLGSSPRALHKLFMAAAGQSPKQVMRVARLGRALRTLHPHPWGGRQHGNPIDEYFDQAHFCRDFKELTTVTPLQYRRSKLLVGDPLVNTLYGQSLAS